MSSATLSKRLTEEQLQLIRELKMLKLLNIIPSVIYFKQIMYIDKYTQFL